MSNDINFKPDWDYYQRMKDDEKRARWRLINLQERLSKNQISYDKYINEIDNVDYYDFLSESDFAEIEDYRKNKKSEINQHIVLKQNTSIKDYFRYFFIFIIVIFVIIIYVLIISI